MKQLIMSEGDIVLEYRQAKDKKKQIGILADENGCTQKVIKAILRNHGLEYPAGPGRPPKAEAAEKPDREAEQTPLEDRAFPEIPELPEIPEDITEVTQDLLLYYQAVQAIARLLDIADADEVMAISFKEQVRGVLAMTYECGG